jgi:hypothetical protein
MRLLCLYFPRLAVRLALRKRPQLEGRPLLLIDGPGDEALITAASGEALAANVIPGLTAGQARARIPNAVFAPDNAGDCLDELERVAAILRVRATPLVALASRDHLFLDMEGVLDRFADEGAAARRMAGLVRAWSGLDVRAGVASTRAEAFEAARAARRFPIVCPEMCPALEAPVQPMQGEIIAAEAAFDRPASDTAARARLVRLLAKLSAVLDARGESFREARIEVRRRDGDFAVPLRPSRPFHAAGDLLDLLTGRVPDGGFEGATGLRVVLGRLGPDVFTRPCAANRARSRPAPAAAVVALARSA